MATRDELIDSKAAELLSSRHSGWNLAAAKKFAASLPPVPADDGATCKGFPVLTRNGVRVSLELAADINGVARFAKPGKLD